MLPHRHNFSGEGFLTIRLVWHCARTQHIPDNLGFPQPLNHDFVAIQLISLFHFAPFFYSPFLWCVLYVLKSK
nr:MAG TPA: hypothetical protein [Caudoviricetes sp.]